jgi:hypothetical protein
MELGGSCPYPEPDKSSLCSHPIFWWSILILPSHVGLGLPSNLSRTGFPTKSLYAHLVHMCHTPHSSPSRFHHPNTIWWALQTIKRIIMQSSLLCFIKLNVLMWHVMQVVRYRIKFIAQSPVNISRRLRQFLFQIHITDIFYYVWDNDNTSYLWKVYCVSWPVSSITFPFLWGLRPQLSPSDSTADTLGSFTLEPLCDKLSAFNGGWFLYS